MQLDKTRIVTRERDYLDILDLALRVVREFAGPLFLALAAGVAPAMILNAGSWPVTAIRTSRWVFHFCTRCS